jgi:hypothetical protein
MPSRVHSLALPIGLALLALLSAGCAGEKNPVLPPSDTPTKPGGTSSTARSDAGATASEAGQIVPDTLAAADEVGSDVLPGAPCDLLKQDCIDSVNNRKGCYPMGGTGVCLTAGIHVAWMTCTKDTDCDRGLVCITPSGVGSQMLCEPLCDISKSGIASDCASQMCAKPDGYPKGVGYCLSS